MAKFTQLIIDKAQDFLSLEIQTIVGEINFNDKKKVVPGEGAKQIITQIDLLDGDIRTAFSDEFLKPPLDKVREFHAEREKQGQKIIEDNIKVLKELVDLVLTAIKGDKDADKIQG